MTQILVILCFAAVHLRDEYAYAPGLSPITSGAITLAGLGLIWLSHLGAMALFGHRIDRTGSWRAVVAADRATLAANVCGAIWFATFVLVGGLLDGVRALVGDTILLDELLALLIPLAFLAAVWWSYEPIDRRLGEAALIRRLDEGGEVYLPQGRSAFVVRRLRHHVLLSGVPLTIIIGWSELIGWISHAWLSHWPPSAGEALRIAGVLAIFVVSPAIMRRVWGAKYLDGSGIAAMVDDMRRLHKVRVRGPLLLPTGGTSVNAAILGVMWPFRYVLFSDALLEHLSPVHIEAVTAHEIAHVRRHHIPWLGALMLSIILLLGGMMGLVIDFWPVSLPAWLVEFTPEIAGMASLAIGALAFGYVSRRFEWQADAFAAAHVSRRAACDVVTPEGALALSDALDRVARLNHMPQDRFFFRHGSIRTRRRRLAALVGTPLDAMPIDQEVSRIKNAIGVMVLLLVVALALLTAVG
jgi:STE24 endopeptidase